MQEYPEILLIDKPSGMTSFDVVAIIRKKLNPKPRKGEMRSDSEPWIRLKVGHAGTLDPLATGLMILGVGKGTKKLTEFIKLDKEYVAEVMIGERRSTGDMEGEILEEVEVSEIPQKKIIEVVQSMLGTQTLPVSAYSAIKVDGKPMYKRAREAEKKGELVTEVPVRDMVVHEVELLGQEYKKIDGKNRLILNVRFFVGSGTYIRSLAEEIGKRLGYPATLYSLRRTQIGDFYIKDAQPLDGF